MKDLDILGGTPVFRGTRIPFQALLDYLEGGETLDEFIYDFPTVSRIPRKLKYSLPDQECQTVPEAGGALPRRNDRGACACG